MTSRLPLRDYQRDCIDAINVKRDEGLRRIASVLPTGAGKTVVFAQYAAEFKDANPDKRVLILAHTDELVEQAAGEYRDVDHGGEYSVGIVKASQDEPDRDIVIGSRDTIISPRRRARILDVGLIIIDECHHVVSPTYMTILDHFGAFDSRKCLDCSGRGYIITEEHPIYGLACMTCCESGKLKIDSDVLTLGFTATLTRADRASLGKVWEAVAYRQDIGFMIRRGYLKGVKGKRIEVPDLDLSKIKKTAGDYSTGDLGTAITDSLAPDIVAKAYIEHASDRSGLIFTPTVASAYVMSDAINAIGISGEVVHGALPKEERRDIIQRFKQGKIQVLSNCMVLTEGFNAPIASCAVIARPTKSAGLYQQMVGRVLRLYPGVPEALILDVTGVSALHDLASLVDLVGEEVGEKTQRLQEGDEQAEGDESDDGSYFYRGVVVAKDFDPLAKASAWVWNVTTGGAMFLSAGVDAYVFLAPSAEGDGTFDVCWCSKDRYKRSGGFTEHRSIAAGYAVAWAENEAFQRGGGDDSAVLTKKKASWRKKAATDKQLSYARSLGIVVAESDRSGDIGNKIDQHLASQRIDPIVRALTGGGR